MRGSRDARAVSSPTGLRLRGVPGFHLQPRGSGVPLAVEDRRLEPRRRRPRRRELIRRPRSGPQHRHFLHSVRRAAISRSAPMFLRLFEDHASGSGRQPSPETRSGSSKPESGQWRRYKVRGFESRSDSVKYNSAAQERPSRALIRMRAPRCRTLPEARRACDRESDHRPSAGRMLLLAAYDGWSL